MPSITFYFFAAAIMLIIVILSVPSESRTLYPAYGHPVSGQAYLVIPDHRL